MEFQNNLRMEADSSVAPDDKEELASVLQQLIDDDSYREKLATEALEASRNHFLWANTARSSTTPFSADWRREPSGLVAKFLPTFPGSAHGLDVRRPGNGYYLLRAVAIFVLIARRLLGVLQYGVVVGAVALVNMVVNYARLGSSVVLLRAMYRRIGAASPFTGSYSTRSLLA